MGSEALDGHEQCKRGDHEVDRKHLLLAATPVRGAGAEHQQRHAHGGDSDEHGEDVENFLEPQIKGIGMEGGRGGPRSRPAALAVRAQLGHSNLGTTSIYLHAIDPEEIIGAVRARRPPMMCASAGLRL